jgi:hypothetical protein
MPEGTFPGQAAGTGPAGAGSEHRSQSSTSDRAIGDLLRRAAPGGRIPQRRAELAFELRLRPIVTASSEQPQATGRIAASELGFRTAAGGEVAPAPATANHSEPGPRPLAPHYVAPQALDARAGHVEVAAGSPQQARQPVSQSSGGPSLDPAHDAGPAVPSVRDLQFQVEGPQGRPVTVRIHDQQGRLHVAVHTPHGEYAQTLRNRVNELIGDMESRGFRAEAAPPAAAESADSARGGPRQDQGGPAAQEPWSGHDHPSGGSDHSGRERRQQSEIEPEHQASPDARTSWSDELESAISGKD